MFPQIAAEPQSGSPCSCLCFLITRGGYLTSLLPGIAGAEAPRGVNTGLIRGFTETLSPASPPDKSPPSSRLTWAETSWSQSSWRPPWCHGWWSKLSGNTLTGWDKLPPLGLIPRSPCSRLWIIHTIYSDRLLYKRYVLCFNVGTVKLPGFQNVVMFSKNRLHG